MTRQPDYKIAKPERCSITLLLRRAWWANDKGYPRWKGHCIDPAYVPKESYQAAVSAWYQSLDDKAKTFLGREYERMAAIPATPRK